MHVYYALPKMTLAMEMKLQYSGGVKAKAASGYIGLRNHNQKPPAERGQRVNQCAPWIRGEQYLFKFPLHQGTEPPAVAPLPKGAALRRGELLPSAFLLCHKCARIAR